MTHSSIEKTQRKTDMMCSGHALLRDRYRRYATGLDVAMLALTTWLAAMAFADPKFAIHLTPFGFDKDLWLGLLAIGTFFLSLVQMKLDWRGLSEAHASASRAFAEVTQACRFASEKDPPSTVDVAHLRARYA